MIKLMLLLFFSLLVVGGLFGECSIVQSPNGHFYYPTYLQSENYTPVPVTNTSLIIENALMDPILNSEVIQSADSTVIILEGPGALTIIGDNGVYIDGDRVLDNYIQVIGSNVQITLPLQTGHHKIEYNTPLLLGRHTFTFMIVSSGYYYQNYFSKIFPLSQSTSDHGSIRPVLFVEGFSAPGLVDGGAGYTESIISKWRNTLSDSRIYMLSLNNPTNDLRDNSMVVLGALRYIHSINSLDNVLLTEGTSVYGYSMGGVLARYALAFAEHWNIPHYCNQFISLDAPHKGVGLNNNFQDMIVDLNNWMHANEEYFVIGGQDAHQLDPYIEGLQTPAAKQMIRNNKFAANGDMGSYINGSTNYNEFFAEINEEERNYYELSELPGYEVRVLNEVADPEFEGFVKPGFPYKQNNIKCFAYSNGSLECNGSGQDNVADYDIHIHIGPITSSDNGSASSEPYDYPNQDQYWMI